MDPVISAREPQNRSDHNWSPARHATRGSAELRGMNACWRAANDLSVGHWGTAPGRNFIDVHVNRLMNKYDLDMFYIDRNAIPQKRK